MSQASPVLKSATVESRRPRSGFSWLQNSRSKPNNPLSEGPVAALRIAANPTLVGVLVLRCGRRVVVWRCNNPKQQPRPSRAESSVAGREGRGRCGLFSMAVFGLFVCFSCRG